MLTKKRNRDEEDEEDNDVKEFLEELFCSFRNYDSLPDLDKVLYHLENPEYELILKRAWCLNEFSNWDEKLTQNEISRRLGSKAVRKAASSSVLTQAKKFLNLISRLHNLRFFVLVKNKCINY
jgi:hypothetical protein